MNKTLKSVLYIVAVVTVVYFGNKGVQSYLGKQAVGDLSFTVHELDEAKAIAAKEGKLVLADYSAIWCPSCRKLDKEVFANKNVANSIDTNFIYTRLEHDTEQGNAFARQYDLVGFPRVLVLDPEGNQLVEMPLTFDPVEYEFNLDRVVDSLTLK